MPSPLLFLDSDNAASLSRRTRRGELRRLYPGIYSTDTASAPETLVARHWLEIVSHLYPGAVLSHRSAVEGKPVAGLLYLTTGRRTRDLALPGLTLKLLQGPPAVAEEDPTRDMPVGGLFLSSEPRRLLENLQAARGVQRKALGAAWVEEHLERAAQSRGLDHLNTLRDTARGLAQRFGWQTEFSALDGMIGALLGTRDAARLKTAKGRARANRQPYDAARLPLFDALFSHLNREPVEEFPELATSDAARAHSAFFESYFSNYIEGTTFTVEEASDIVFRGRIAENRPADAHDVLGTFQVAAHPQLRRRLPSGADDFIAQARALHASVLSARPEALPGRFKEQANRAGTTTFVAPDLVDGTLRQGWLRIAALSAPFARAAMTMFVLAEVHPFKDGNGRIARLMMNACLSAADRTRIIVSTLFREDYLLALKTLSHNSEPGPLVRALHFAYRWSAAFDFADFDAVWRALQHCHAFEEVTRDYRLGFPRITPMPFSRSPRPVEGRGSQLVQILYRPPLMARQAVRVLLGRKPLTATAYPLRVHHERRTCSAFPEQARSM